MSSKLLVFVHKNLSLDLKQIQHIIQIQFLSYMQLIFRLCHIIQQKFQDQRTSKSPAFDLKICKSHRQIDIFDIIYTDKSRICHCF